VVVNNKKISPRASGQGKTSQCAAEAWKPSDIHGRSIRYWPCKKRRFL